MSQQYKTTVTQDENEWFHPRVIEMLRYEPESPGRTPLIREVLTHLHEAKTLAGWTRSLSRKFRLENESEDVGQIIAAAIATFLFTVKQQKIDRMQRQYLQQFWNIANLGVKTYQEGGEHTGMAGFTSISRRKKLIARAQVELAHRLQREPTSEEIKSHINEQMLATRKNAVKQGVLIRDSDFTAGIAFSGDQEVFENGEATVHDTITDQKSNNGFLQIEVTDAMHALVTHMRQQHPDEPHIIQCTIEWARCVLSGEDPTPFAVNREVGCGIRAAERCVSKLLGELPAFAVAFDA